MSELAEQERLQRLLLYVRGHGPVSRAQLQRALPECYAPYEGDADDAAAAKRHDDTIRKRLQRDRAKLQALGFTLSVGEDDRYAFDAAATFTHGDEQRDWSEEDACVVRQVASARLLDPDVLGKDALRCALAKVCIELDAPDALPLVEREAPLIAEPHGLQKALKAIRLRKHLQFEYCDAKGAASSRSVEPFGTFVHNHHCYIVAFDVDAQENRTFRLDRMSRLKVNAREGAAPDFDERPFRLEDHYRLPFQMGDCDTEAMVSFDAELAWKAPALTMHRGSLATSDGGVLWTISTADPDALASWCIEHGPGIAPVAPPQARAAYEGALTRSLEACR